MELKRQKNDLSRFWELFLPTTNNFQFWLASAAFSFFVYASLGGGAVVEGVAAWFREITAWIFLVFGWLCIAMLVYLFISWRFGFKIEAVSKKKKGGKANGYKGNDSKTD